MRHSTETGTNTTDRLGSHVAYTYDATGNQTSVSYPDGTTATKEYDLVGNPKRMSNGAVLHI